MVNWQTDLNLHKKHSKEPKDPAYKFFSSQSGQASEGFTETRPIQRA